MMWRPLLLAVAVAGVFGPRRALAQACALSPEYASPALFVGAHAGGWRGAELRGVTLRGATRFVVGAMHYDQGEEAITRFEDLEEGRFVSVGGTLIGKFSVDNALGAWICPLVRIDARRFANDGSATDRHATDVSYGVAIAVPVPVTGRLGAVVQTSLRRMRLTYGEKESNVEFPFSVKWRTDILGVGLGLSWNETYTVVYTLEAPGSESRLPDHIRGGGRQWRVALGYHFPRRR